MIQAEQEQPFAEPICHVHHLDLISDPVATVEAVYAHFGLMLPETAARRIAQAVAEQPNGGYGRHDYRFEDHGLDEEAEHDRFRAYMVAFGIERESRPRGGRRAAVSAGASAG